jgi:hypothetical protein
MDRPRKRPAVSYATARAFTVALTSLLWSGVLALVGFGFSALLTRDNMSAVAIGYLMAGTFVFIPLFAAQGVLLGMLEGLARGDFRLPPGLDRSPGAPAGAGRASVRPASPWSPALRWALGLGAPAALLAYLAAPWLWPLGLSRASFVLRLVCCGALLAATTSFFVSGRVFLRQALIPRQDRAWIGSRARYLWTRHALPNGLANAIINALVAFVVFPQPPLDPDHAMNREMMVGDTFLTLVILTLAITTGARAHARSDLRWGVIAVERERAAPGIVGQLLRLLGLSLALGGSLLAFLHTAGIESCGLPFFVAWRAVAFGVYPALVAYLVAYWAPASLRLPGEVEGGA